MALPPSSVDTLKKGQSAVQHGKSACITMGPRCLSDLAVHGIQVRSAAPDAVDAAVAGLRYGCVAVNTPGALPFALTRATWGGYPGTTIQVRALIAVLAVTAYT